MSRIRMERIAEELRERISEILHSRMRDPRLTWVSVIRVQPSPDLKYAKVFISVLGDDKAQEEGLHALDRAKGAIRIELSRRTKMKRVPEISFHADHSIEYSLRVQEILRDLGFTGDVSDAQEDEESE